MFTYYPLGKAFEKQTIKQNKQQQFKMKGENKQIL